MHLLHITTQQNSCTALPPVHTKQLKWQPNNDNNNKALRGVQTYLQMSGDQTTHQQRHLANADEVRIYSLGVTILSFGSCITQDLTNNFLSIHS